MSRTFIFSSFLILAVHFGFGPVATDAQFNLFRIGQSRLPKVIGIKEDKPGCCGRDGIPARFSSVAPEYEYSRLSGTYYTTKDGLSASLMLNNKGPEPILGNATFYSLAGTRFQPAPITVPAASYIEVPLEQLLANAGEEFREGSLKISYQGGDLQVGAQIKLIDPQRKLIWAEQLVYTSKFVSSRLENLWWLPGENAATRFVVSNTSSGTVTATIRADGTTPSQTSLYQVTLAPWETRILNILADIVGNASGTLHTKGGISIEHTGGPGAVLARMDIARPNVGYSATASFVDPENTATQRWHGNGFRFRNVDGASLESGIALRNVGTQLSRVKGRIIYTKPNGDLATINLPERQIPAGATRVFDLGPAIANANVPASVETGGIEIEYETPKGTIITSVQSGSPNGEHVFQVPMFDPQKIPSSAGGFPWKADGDHRTLVYIKNETSATRRYTASLVWSGGGYNLGVREIRGGETVTIDFRKLRDEQTPDPVGNLVPLNLEKAQIGWSARGGEGKVLSGRSEQVSLTEGVASTYACYNCCSDVFVRGWVEPYAASIGVGNSLVYTGKEVYANCYLQEYSPNWVWDVSWLSYNSSVATISSFSGDAEGVSPGGTYIEGSWEADQWFNNLGYCQYNPVPVIASEPVEVTPSVTDVTATGATRITQVTGDASIFHFVTPKGAANSQVTLTATLSDTSTQILNDISWDGATESASNPLQATVTKDSAKRETVKIKYRGQVLKELRVWVVWATITSLDIPVEVVPGNTVTGIPLGPALAVRGGYNFVHTISPASIVTDPNRPNFSGSNTTSPPGGNHPFNGGSLSGGANKK